VDSIREPVRQTAHKGAREPPLASWFSRAQNLAADDAFRAGPVDPARIVGIPVGHLFSPPFHGEGVKIARTHGMDKRAMEISPGSLNNLKPDHMLVSEEWFLGSVK